MSHIDELMNEISLEQEAFLASEEYRILNDNVEAGHMIQSLKEHPGWKLLQGKLKARLDVIKHDLLFGEEPDDPVLAKIQRQEKRAFGKAVILLADHVDSIVRVQKESLKILQDKDVRPEMDIE
jgi:hypothetical protein